MSKASVISLGTLIPVLETAAAAAAALHYLADVALT